ncbi:MAG: hypothetical protein M0Q48_06635 [Verrucomicrobia bacterium]|nr:hypothetical protein [Verrucomicrobiota bacterium]
MKNIKKIILTSFLILINCFIILFILLPSIDIPKYKNYYILTEVNLKQIDLSVQNIEQIENNKIDFIIKNGYNIELPLRDKFFILIKKEFGDDIDIPTFYEKFTKDGWGTPLNLDYTTNLTGLSESLSNALSKFSIVVWSSGPNKIDERYLGDDIPWVDSRE